MYKLETAPIESFEYSELPRVTRWFDNPSSIFEEDKNYIDVNPKAKNWLITSHAFSRQIDSMIFNLGIQTPWHSRSHIGRTDLCLNIPGEITTASGQRNIGIFSYAFFQKSNGMLTCYHRHFSKWPKNELLKQKLKQGYWNVEFPPLTPAQRSEANDSATAKA